MENKSKIKKLKRNKIQRQKRMLVSNLFSETRGSGWLTEITELYTKANGLVGENLTNSLTIMGNAYDILKFSILREEDHPY